jgi:hypothetical protein
MSIWLTLIRFLTKSSGVSREDAVPFGGIEASDLARAYYSFPPSLLFLSYLLQSVTAGRYYIGSISPIRRRMSEVLRS